MHRKHDHMHTCNTAGINADLATNLEINFTWSLPLARQGPASNDNSSEGPESITPVDFDPAFDELDQKLKEAPRNSEMVGGWSGGTRLRAMFMILRSWRG